MTSMVQYRRAGYLKEEHEAFHRGCRILWNPQGLGTKSYIPSNEITHEDLVSKQAHLDSRRRWPVAPNLQETVRRARRLAGHIFTERDAFKAAQERVIPETVLYCTLAGVRNFEKMLAYESSETRDNPYFPSWAELDIIRHNAAQDHFYVPKEDYYLVSFGGGSGWKEREQIRITQHQPVRAIDIDSSVEYGKRFEDNVPVVYGGGKRILPLDFMYFGEGVKSDALWTGHDSLWADENWFHEIRAPDDPTPIVFTMYGATLGNFSWPDITRFLRNLSTKMRPGDIAYIGVDSTLDERLLFDAYNIPPFHDIAHENVEFVYHRRLGLTGFDWNKIKLNITDAVKVTLEVADDHPELKVTRTKINWALVAKEIARSFKGSSIQLIGSSRMPQVGSKDVATRSWEQAFKEGWLNIVGRVGAEGQPLGLSPEALGKRSNLNYGLYNCTKA